VVYLDYEVAPVLADPLLTDAEWVALLASSIVDTDTLFFGDLRRAANEADEAAAAVLKQDAITHIVASGSRPYVHILER